MLNDKAEMRKEIHVSSRRTCYSRNRASRGEKWWSPHSKIKFHAPEVRMYSQLVKAPLADSPLLWGRDCVHLESCFTDIFEAFCKTGTGLWHLWPRCTCLACSLLWPLLRSGVCRGSAHRFCLIPAFSAFIIYIY